MTDRIDHAAEARKHVEWAHAQQASYGEFEESVQHNATLAVAEAVLALVEQQRIANRITLGTVLSDTAAQGYIGGVLFTPEHEFSMTELLPEIREGLGL